MTRDELMALIAKMHDASQLPQHWRDYVTHIAEMVYADAYRNGRIDGLEAAAKTVEAA